LGARHQGPQHLAGLAFLVDVGTGLRQENASKR
jgi:hypothetical protein